MKIVTKKELVIICIGLIPVIFISVLLIMDEFTKDETRLHSKAEAIAFVNMAVDRFVKEEGINKFDIKLIDYVKEDRVWYFDYEYKKSGKKKNISWYVTETGWIETYIDSPPYYHKRKSGKN